MKITLPRVRQIQESSPQKLFLTLTQNKNKRNYEKKNNDFIVNEISFLKGSKSQSPQYQIKVRFQMSK